MSIDNPIPTPHLPITYPPTHTSTTYLPTYPSTHLPTYYSITHPPTHLPPYWLLTLPPAHPHMTHLLTYLPTFYFLFFITYPLPTYHHKHLLYLPYSLVVIWNKHVKQKNWPKLDTFWCCSPLVKTLFTIVKVKGSIPNICNLCVFLRG
jgi:hypothetical protein